MTAKCPDFQFDSVEVRVGAFQVLRDGKPLALEPKAVRVLIFLAENRQRAVTKEELIEAVWSDVAVTDNAVTRVIAQLRRELGDDARQPRYIQTIPTVGYRFVADVRDSVAAPAPAAIQPRGTDWRPVLGLFAAALVAVAWFLVRTPADPAPPDVSSRQFTTSPGLDFSGGFSPDGRSMAYASDRSGKFEIYVRAADGAIQEQQITSDGGQNIHPSWSPDGRWIAYHSVRRGGVWIIPASGGEPRQIAGIGAYPAWSPDSASIVYRKENVFSVSANDLISTARSNLAISDVTSGATRDLTRVGAPPGKHAFPTWHPNGKRILFASIGGPDSGLWMISPDGANLRRVAHLPGGILIFPVFGPRGESVYYGSFAKSRDFGIWRIPLSGESATGKPVEIIRTGTAIPRDLAISRDGKRLAYTASHQSSNLWALDLRADAEPAGAPKPLYSDNVYRTTVPVFSPDGSKIAFFARVFGAPGDIWTMNADGAGAAPLTSAPATEILPSWTPDGRSVVYTRNIHGPQQVWRISVADRSEQPLFSGRTVQGWPRLSRDGTEMVWHENRDGTLNIWKTRASELEPKQLTFDREGAGYPAWSPDGKWIAYEIQRGPNMFLCLMDRDGGGQRELNAKPGQNWVYDWSPDSRKISFAGFRDGEWNLYWIDVATGRERKLTGETSIARYMRYPAWSPDGRTLVYEYGQTRGNVFLVNIDERPATWP